MVFFIVSSRRTPDQSSRRQDPVGDQGGYRPQFQAFGSQIAGSQIAKSWLPPLFCDLRSRDLRWKFPEILEWRAIPDQGSVRPGSVAFHNATLRMVASMAWNSSSPSASKW